MSTSYCSYFRGKRITVMGLGLLGRGVGDVQFLAECGADLIVTDLKPASELQPSLKKLRRFKNIRYVLGRHDLESFHDRELILKGAGVPLDSPYLAAARKNKIPVLMSTALFTKLAPTKKIIGVTGTRGKSTTTQLIYEILKQAGYRVWLGGNLPRVSTLALLKKVKPGDWVVLELDSWQLQGFGDLKISPPIAVFTNFLPDHLNYYSTLKRYWADKENIFKWQKRGNYLVLGPKFKSQKSKFKVTAKSSKVIIADPTQLPKTWRIKLAGEHHRENLACALAVAKILRVPQRVVRKAVERFKSLPGRLEFVAEVAGVKYINDTTATIPEATLATLKALKEKFPQAGIVLIAGGADKGLEFKDFGREVPKEVKAVILFRGPASEKIKAAISWEEVPLYSNLRTMTAAVKIARQEAQPGDLILLSPAAASFGLFQNEFDRGEQFNQLVKHLTD